MLPMLLSIAMVIKIVKVMVNESGDQIGDSEWKRSVGVNIRSLTPKPAYMRLFGARLRAVELTARL
jgi:hypothetical protein